MPKQGAHHVTDPLVELLTTHQRRLCNNLTQRQSRFVREAEARAAASSTLEDQHAIKQEIADYKARVVVEKTRVRLDHKILLAHRLTEQIWNDPGLLNTFRGGLDHSQVELKALSKVRFGKGLEHLELDASDIEFGVADKQDEPEPAVEADVQLAARIQESIRGITASFKSFIQQGQSNPQVIVRAREWLAAHGTDLGVQSSDGEGDELRSNEDDKEDEEVEEWTAKSEDEEEDKDT
ncbi:protein of unknown function [Taphrina deformans PYCC 5710]|uniref:Uncharacterized protein n=1 Tax=Taphrina deformans (strain PYCC 5710 / ATCC 11124 / CBS 356.35 / IMI 108563 / JCM 9778 / NBRC 8474) TaxID=1097556 RepID=R4XL38_TAPDE|nr:protein of unknown function [Taphrina deformans PYCC 5710]|eukprot:CCG85115.1 protein of unknown function [Taphrina deformans PYCC 5710]